MFTRVLWYWAQWSPLIQVLATTLLNAWELHIYIVLPSNACIDIQHQVLSIYSQAIMKIGWMVPYPSTVDFWDAVHTTEGWNLIGVVSHFQTDDWWKNISRKDMNNSFTDVYKNCIWIAYYTSKRKLDHKRAVLTGSPLYTEPCYSFECSQNKHVWNYWYLQVWQFFKQSLGVARNRKDRKYENSPVNIQVHNM